MKFGPTDYAAIIIKGMDAAYSLIDDEWPLDAYLSDADQPIADAVIELHGFCRDALTSVGRPTYEVPLEDQESMFYAMHALEAFSRLLERIALAGSQDWLPIKPQVARPEE